MKAAAQREIFRQALALPVKARLELYKRLVASLDSTERKRKTVSGTRVVAEQAAVYGKTKEADTRISRKDWNKTWKVELDRRIKDIESGRVKSIPYSEVRKKMDRILGKS